jgi:hypothetical protein
LYFHVIVVVELYINSFGVLIVKHYVFCWQEFHCALKSNIYIFTFELCFDFSTWFFFFLTPIFCKESFKLDLVLGVFKGNAKHLVGIYKGFSFGGLISLIFWRIQRFDVFWWFLCIVSLLVLKVYLWLVVCLLMWQTNPHKQTPFVDLVVLFFENESSSS